MSDGEGQKAAEGKPLQLDYATPETRVRPIHVLIVYLTALHLLLTFAARYFDFVLRFPPRFLIATYNVLSQPVGQLMLNVGTADLSASAVSWLAIGTLLGFIVNSFLWALASVVLWRLLRRALGHKGLHS